MVSAPRGRSAHSHGGGCAVVRRQSGRRSPRRRAQLRPGAAGRRQNGRAAETDRMHSGTRRHFGVAASRGADRVQCGDAVCTSAVRGHRRGRVRRRCHGRCAARRGADGRTRRHAERSLRRKGLAALDRLARRGPAGRALAGGVRAVRVRDARRLWRPRARRRRGARASRRDAARLPRPGGGARRRSRGVRERGHAPGLRRLRRDRGLARRVFVQWRRRNNPPERLAILGFVALCTAVGWIADSQRTALDADHVVAFAIGIGVAGARFRVRLPRLARVSSRH